MQALVSLSLSLSTTCFQIVQIVCIQIAKSNQGQTGIPVSERPTLRPMPRKNIIEP